MIAYLDNAATTRPCDAAIGATIKAMSEQYYNPSALYGPAIQVEKAIDSVRTSIRAALSAQQGAHVLFTSGGTEANNLAILGSTQAMHGAVHVVTSAAEHASVRTCMDALKDQGHRITALPLHITGEIDWNALEDCLRNDPPALISLMHVNNETGALLDVPRLSALARKLAPSALIHVDGVQGFMKIPIDMRLIDLYSLSAHKIHGAKGVGALVVQKNIRLKSRQFGGSQQSGMRPGTENAPGILALGAAISHMQGLPNRAADMLLLKRRFCEAVLCGVPGASINGPNIESGAPHILNISFPGMRAEVMLHALEGDGIFCSTGSACSSKKRSVSPILAAMGIPIDQAEGALRFSFSPHTEASEIDYAAECIAKQYALLRRFQRR